MAAPRYVRGHGYKARGGFEEHLHLRYWRRYLGLGVTGDGGVARFRLASGPRKPSALSVALLVLRWAGGSAASQAVRENRLGPPLERLEREFSGIIGVRELRDGRLLVSDEKEGQLVVADLRSGLVFPIGSTGRGPGESEAPGVVFPLGQDSTLMVHALSRRGLVLSGTTIARTLPPDAVEVADGFALAGADAEGRVLVVRREPVRKAAVTILGQGDSSYLVLVHRGSGQADTIGRARVAETRLETEQTASGGVRSRQRLGSPVAVAEPALVALDGWVVVVRRDPYRVEWRSPAGRWTVGRAIAYPRVRLDAREKEAVIRLRRAERGPRHPPAEFFTEWPEYYPPFEQSPVGTALLTMDGKVVIRRARTARAPEARYDVVDRRGELLARVVLGVNQLIAGFGRGVVYVVSTDNDGLQYLSRHAWAY
jgi:hypothetical protein